MFGPVHALCVYQGLQATYYRLADGVTFNTSPDATGGYGDLFALMALKGEPLQVIHNAKVCDAGKVKRRDLDTASNRLVAKAMAQAFERAMVPVCRRCGCTDISAEVTAARWDASAQEWAVSDICDKGHYCDACDSETQIDWEIVI